MEAVILQSGPPREAIEQAGEVLAAFLKEFCDAAIAGLQSQREFLTCCRPLLEDVGASPEAWELDMSDVARAIRRIERAREHPRPRARRELKRLTALLDGVPFERLVVAPNSVVASLTTTVPGRAAASGTAFEIRLQLLSTGLFPVFIRKPTATGQELLFVDGGRHGACRGEAAPLLETAVEHLDLCGLVLVALAWARRNV